MKLRNKLLTYCCAMALHSHAIADCMKQPSLVVEKFEDYARATFQYKDCDDALVVELDKEITENKSLKGSIKDIFFDIVFDKEANIAINRIVWKKFFDGKENIVKAVEDGTTLLLPDGDCFGLLNQHEYFDDTFTIEANKIYTKDLILIPHNLYINGKYIKHNSGSSLCAHYLGFESNTGIDIVNSMLVANDISMNADTYIEYYNDRFLMQKTVKMLTRAINTIYCKAGYLKLNAYVTLDNIVGIKNPMIMLANDIKLNFDQVDIWGGTLYAINDFILYAEKNNKFYIANDKEYFSDHQRAILYAGNNLYVVSAQGENVFEGAYLQAVNSLVRSANGNVVITNRRIDLSPDYTDKEFMEELEKFNKIVKLKPTKKAEDFHIVIRGDFVSSGERSVVIGDDGFMFRYGDTQVYKDPSSRSGYEIVVVSNALSGDSYTNSSNNIFIKGSNEFAERSNEYFANSTINILNSYIGGGSLAFEASRLAINAQVNSGTTSALSSAVTSKTALQNVYQNFYGITPAFTRSTFISDNPIKFKVKTDVVAGNVIANQLLDFTVNGNAFLFGTYNTNGQIWQVEGNFINLAKIDDLASISIKALNIALLEKINANDGLSLNAVENLVMHTLVSTVTNGNNIKTDTISSAGASSKGNLHITSGRDMDITAANIQGDNIVITAGGHIYVMPARLYNKVSEYGYRYHNHLETLAFMLTDISADESFKMSSSDDIMLNGVQINSPLGIIEAAKRFGITSPKGYVSSDVFRKSKRKWAGSRTVHDKSYEEYVYDNNFSGGDYLLTSGSDMSLQALNMDLYNVKLVAGSPEEAATIAFIPMREKKIYEAYRRKSGFLGSSSSGSGKSEDTPLPTLVSARGSIYGIAEGGTWIQVCSNMIAAEEIFLKAKEIKLTVDPTLGSSYTYLNKKGIGFSFNADVDELSVGLGFKHSRFSNNEYWTHHKPVDMKASHITMIADESIEDVGVYYHAKVMEQKAKFTTHGELIDSTYSKEEAEKAFMGISFGIKSALGSTYSGVKGVVEADYNRPEGYVNAFFAGLRAYTGGLKLMGNPSSIFSLGAWADVNYEKTTSTKSTTTSIPVHITVEDLLTSESEELKLLGTQINVHNAYIKAKNLHIEAGVNTEKTETKSSSFDMDIPVSSGTTSSLNVALSKGVSNKKIHFNTKIQASGTLEFDVVGHADMKGVYISANNLVANFGSLMIASVQDIIEHQSKGASLGVSFDSGDDAKLTPGINFATGKRHIVQEMSQILGREKAIITVANALRMNGAMIANAEKEISEDGKFKGYTDHGNLVLTYGSLFFEHIKGYDNGITLGLAVDKAGTMPSFGGHSGYQVTRATIGQGTISCPGMTGNSCIPEGVNRDVNQAQEEHTRFDIREINAFIPDTPISELKAKLPKKKDGSVDWGKIGTNIVKGFADSVRSFWGDNEQKIISEKEPELNNIIGTVEPLPEVNVEEFEYVNVALQNVNKELSSLVDSWDEYSDIQKIRYKDMFHDIAYIVMDMDTESQSKFFNTFDNYVHSLEPNKEHQNTATKLYSLFGTEVKANAAPAVDIMKLGEDIFIEMVNWIIPANRVKQAMSLVKTAVVVEQNLLNEVKDDFKWEVKESKDADRIVKHERFGKFYRDPKQKINNKNIWWTKDQARHGGSKYKIYVKNGNKMEHFADLDEFGKVISKHKGDVGDVINWKSFVGVK